MGRLNSWFPGGVLLLCAAAGCDDSGPPLRTGGGPSGVVFEVGGGGDSLGDLLENQPAVDDPRGRRIVAVPTAEQISGGPARRWRTVALKPGQTLSQLCAEQLGSAERWREVARLNGWSEDDVRRLSTGELVRLPPA